MFGLSTLSISSELFHAVPLNRKPSCQGRSFVSKRTLLCVERGAVNGKGRLSSRKDTLLLLNIVERCHGVMSGLSGGTCFSSSHRVRAPAFQASPFAVDDLEGVFAFVKRDRGMCGSCGHGMFLVDVPIDA